MKTSITKSFTSLMQGRYSKGLFVSLTFIVLFSFQLKAQEVEWDRTVGGNREDRLTALEQTSDKGYILGGYAESGISGDKTEASPGNPEYWVVKLDMSGNKEWDKSFGSDGGGVLWSLQQTSDGGYILGCV